MEFSGDYNPKEFCWRDLELLTDFFSEENFIGKINFGKVYRGKTQQGQQVTVKIWLHQPDERDCYTCGILPLHCFITKLLLHLGSRVKAFFCLIRMLYITPIW